ncbi:Hypothetical protein ING2D1G_0196 [Peptoniphilus sp. ING2-D1G]|nr:Hypothetical protein ING2D1G_0196 [Peptoniphilus sp. ING2-D1G]
MKKYLIFVLAFILIGCTKNDTVSEKENKDTDSKLPTYTIDFASGEKYSFNTLKTQIMREDGDSKTPEDIELSDEMIEQITELLSSLKKSDEENHQDLHDGDIELLFDQHLGEFTYEYFRICDIKPYGKNNARYYKFDSENEDVDGVYETQLDLLKEIKGILKVQ